MATRYPKIKPIKLTIQQLQLKAMFPESISTIRNHCELIWKSKLLPSPLSQEYLVQLNYKITSHPKVKVLEPDLTVTDGQKLPHVYPYNYLCLFYPKYREWKAEFSLADTIVPWISDWLLHYEIWLVTGAWHGDGIHPPEGQQKIQ